MKAEVTRAIEIMMGQKARFNHSLISFLTRSSMNQVQKKIIAAMKVIRRMICFMVRILADCYPLVNIQGSTLKVSI